METTDQNVYLVETSLGLVLLDEDMRPLATFPFEDPKLGRKVIEDLRIGDVSSEIRAMLRDTLESDRKLVVEGFELVQGLSSEWGERVVLMAPSKGGEWCRGNPGALASIFRKEADDALRAAREFAFEESKEAVIRAATNKEKAMLEAVKSYGSVTQTLNELSERYEDWAELLWPGFLRTFRSLDSSLKFLSSCQSLRDWDDASLSRLGLGGREIDKVKETFRGIGTSPVPSFPVLCTYASTLLSLIDLKERLTNHIEELAKEICPNVVAVAGPSLAAKLVAKVGGTMELAKLPSSTIQVIGAEKALFRSLKTGARPPKHGLIFQHPLVHSSPRKLRGKIARVLSSKISLAAKMDVFSGQDATEELKSGLKAKYNEIMGDVA